MSITVAPLAGLVEALSPAKPEMGAGGDAFGPLIAGLIQPAGTGLFQPAGNAPNGTALPFNGEALPAAPLPVASLTAAGKRTPEDSEITLPAILMAMDVVTPPRPVPAAFMPQRDMPPFSADPGLEPADEDGATRADVEAAPALAEPQLPSSWAPAPAPVAITPPALPNSSPHERTEAGPPRGTAIAGDATPAVTAPAWQVMASVATPTRLGGDEGALPASVPATLPLAVASPPAAVAAQPGVTAPTISAGPTAPTSPRSRLAARDVAAAPVEAKTFAPVDAPPPTQVTAPVILPALQAFGAAIRQALADERAPARQDADAGASLFGIAGTAAPVALSLAPGTATLDTADQRWPHAMAEQIERLRDAADAQSTRIRLLPDALGPVDIAVRREGEQVHVHFAAADAATRQLLADAAPRLAEAADARGLKLGRTDVSGGDLADGGQPQRNLPQQPQSSRPAPARPRIAADSTDTRIA